MKINISPSPTGETYNPLQKAFEYFNKHLFDNELPECLITLQRKASSLGYFSPASFQHRRKHTYVDEVALNPEHFKSRSDRDVLSTLVHEMCHLWQEHFGTPSRKGYHNTEWANLMESIGLMPTDTGKAGGKRSGQHMTHYIIKRGRFDVCPVK